MLLSFVTSERLTKSGSPTSSGARSSIISHVRWKFSGAGRKAVADDYNEDEDGATDGFGDDFDDFEEGEEDAEFGDFDSGFQESEPAPPPPPPKTPTPSFVSWYSLPQKPCLINRSRSSTLPISTPQKTSIRQQNRT